MVIRRSYFDVVWSYATAYVRREYSRATPVLPCELATYAAISSESNIKNNLYHYTTRFGR